jgi:hypothetical protein
VKLFRAFAAAALLFACAPLKPRQYRNGDLDLVSAYTAKEACSCIFVIEQSDEFCRAWTRANPAVAGFTVDRAAKTVTSSALLFWGARARFVGEKFGCVLE